MSNAGGLLDSRVDRSSHTVWLAMGDLLVLIGFLVVGELRHDVNPIDQPLLVADTIAPFLIGWILASLAAGAYSPGATRTVPGAILWGAGTWVVAAVIGLALRATQYFHGGALPSFALVVIGLGMVCFGAWRGAMAYWSR